MLNKNGDTLIVYSRQYVSFREPWSEIGKVGSWIFDK